MSTMVDYTDEQRVAVKARGVSLSLAAGAGCGKTFVLTERFIGELEDSEGEPNSQRIGQLVAITFTDAAARELRTRIRKLVAERTRTANAATRDYWQQLGRAIDSCRISTIHSLCGNLLREHSFDVGLDPMFTVLDAAAARVLELEAVEDMLRRLLADRDEDAMVIATAWGIENAKQVLIGLMSHYRKPEFRQWLDREPSDAIAAWQKFFEREVWPSFMDKLVPVADAVRTLADQVQPKTTEEQDSKAELLEGCERIVGGSATTTDLETVRARAVASRKPFSKSYWASEDDYGTFKGRAEQLREAIKKAPQFDSATESAQQAAELGLRAARVASWAAENYEGAKTQRNALDYEDLLAKTHELLTQPDHGDIQRRLQNNIDVLFVDEFQDTDRVQVDMVRALVGDVVTAGKLFVVGDDKQSIYRFRGAEPQVFVELRGEIDRKWQLPLSTNFRSQPAILQFVNALFHLVFDGDYMPLVPHRPQVTPEPAVEFLWTVVPQPTGRRKGFVDVRRKAEARTIAAKLRWLFDEGPPIVAEPTAPGGCRRANFGDVAILLRTLSNVAHYEEALRAEGINYYLVGGHAFYTQQEIYDILHLLRAIASECDELSLAGVLRSPVFALADETLFWLVAKHKSLERGLFAGSLPGEIDPDERAKVFAAAATLTELRAKKDELQVPQLLSLAMERTGYDAALLADFMGERKLANVYKLVEQARTAVASHVGSLDDFVTQLASFTTTAPKEALATTSPGKSNVVQLMTVHKAKGLEFPVVVVPDLDQRRVTSSSTAEFDHDLGPLVGPAKDSEGDTSGLKLHRHVDRIAADKESNRLFYVACTRAADYLMLSSSINDFDKLEGPWTKHLANSFDLASGRWLGGGTEPDPGVHATVSPAPQSSSRRASKSTDWLKVLEQARRMKPDADVERLAADFAVDPGARRRYSVTRLSGQIVPSGGDWWRDDPEVASDRASDDVDPLGFGTLVHAVLERVDLNQPASIAQWTKVHAPEHDLLHAAAAEVGAQQLVASFFDSVRAAELRTARSIHHELEFTLTWPLGTHTADARYIQGYLDCFYQGDDGRWRVIDYKTNHVSAGGVSQLATKYELQMLVYGLAVEQTWGVGPAELVLHFLRPGVEQVIEWNDETRQRAIELVTKAIENCTN